MPKIIAFIFALAAFFCIGLGVYFAQDQITLSQVGIETTGRVIEIIHSRGRNSSTQYRPRIAFETESNETITFTAAFSTNFHIYAVNDEVPVLYNPRQPSQASINTVFQRWGSVMLPGIIAIVFLLIVYIPIVNRRRREKRLLRLKASGHQFEAKVVDIINAKNYSVTTHHTKVIICEGAHPVTGINAQYESEILFFDPKEYDCPDTLTVYLDRQDNQVYVVDCTELKSRVTGLWYQ